MTSIAEGIEINDQTVTAAVELAGEKLNSAQGETMLDFSFVRRIDASTLRALEELARLADEKEVKVTLKGVCVDVYKVLKLVRLSRRFSFVS
ncbi:MAG TPA: STAS domain-containing protein [Candidatus Bathyarchaeia archaeon]|nr:STAS domain-containing protein [Candidatus Bathyarchaeia archaeon]